MKMICAPSQVMRVGRDLNQHGQAARQEQASSSSPVTFHDVLPAAAAARPGRAKQTMPHTIANATKVLPHMIFINVFLSLKCCCFRGEFIPAKRPVNTQIDRTPSWNRPRAVETHS